MSFIIVQSTFKLKIFNFMNLNSNLMVWKKLVRIYKKLNSFWRESQQKILSFGRVFCHSLIKYKIYNIRFLKRMIWQIIKINELSQKWFRLLNSYFVYLRNVIYWHKTIYFWKTKNSNLTKFQRHVVRKQFNFSKEFTF
jgi:hypothetical protein